MATSADLVIFGASGDLASRKILPSLGRLVTRERQPVTTRRRHILGEGDDGDTLFFGELSDATVKQRRLNR